MSPYQRLLSLAFMMALLAPAPAGAQAAPAFEVASIRPSPEPGPGAKGGLTVTQRQARFSLMSLHDYIGLAYDVRLHQIIGPEWLATARFEILATIPETAQPGQLSPMMRALLEERFTLRTHREQREFSVYALTALPGATLTRLPDEQPGDGPVSVSGGGTVSGVAVDLGQGSTLVLANNRFEARKVTMQTLADVLARFVDRPVVNMTGLEGRYDVTFEVSADDFRAMMFRSALASGASLPPQALQLLDQASPAAVPDALKGLGLSLAGRRAPIDVLVIDSIERMPTDN